MRLDFSSTTPLKTIAHLPDFDTTDLRGRHHGQELIGADAGGRGPLAGGDEVDCAGHDRLELFVGVLSPLQLPGVHDKYVDVAVPDCMLTHVDGVVAMNSDGGVEGLALCLNGGGQFGGDRTGQADVLGARVGVEEGG